ncbi:MAG: carbamate kinase [Deltaproteobacteria bacterium]|nr:carbamate kinase [Deltaproteobacteria bacterium]
MSSSIGAQRDLHGTVVALGGNAFATDTRPLTMRGQFELAERVAEDLLPLLRDAAPLLVTHGNGPQVGHMLTRVERSLGEAYAVPLEVCVAETEGELGYVLMQSLHNVMRANDLQRPVASVLTQVRVDADDPAFRQPSKPIGPFYDGPRAAALRADGFEVMEDAGRGYRRVVASPAPREILDCEVLVALWRMGAVVIGAGGGGVPVVERSGRIEGVEAVVDKDATAELLARLLGARRLLLVTAVPCAYRDFGKPSQRAIGCIDPDEAEAALAEGHFAPGSMAPKVRAGTAFARACAGAGECVICAPENLRAALDGQSGTRIRYGAEGGARAARGEGQ